MQIDNKIENLIIDIKNKIKELIDSCKYIEDINKIHSNFIFFFQQDNELDRYYIKAKNDIRIKIINTTVNDNDIIPNEENSVKEELLNATEYTELQRIYKKNLSEIIKDKFLSDIYNYRKEELLYLRAEEVLKTCDILDLEDKWARIISTITNKDYINALEKIKNNRLLDLKL
jgi:hypothetical protein